MANETKSLKDANPTQQAEVKFPAVRFAVEISNARNQSVVWNSDSKMLRGRWENRRIPAGSNVNPALRRLPDIPGIVIAVDSSKRKILRYDPLCLPKNAELLENIQENWKNLSNVIDMHAQNVGPDNDIRLRIEGDDCSNDELKNTIYWVRRILDCENCVVIEGEVPKMADIFKMPGLVMKNNNEGAIVEKWTDPTKYFNRSIRYAPPTPEAKPDQFDTNNILEEEFAL